jgi:tetratricopeptide (TPR) repeat protein
MMGSEGSSEEELPHKAMGELAESNLQGLVAAYLVRNDPGLLKQVGRKLETMGQSPDQLSDRAVMMLLEGNIEDALRWADRALAGHPHHPQALWNRGLALRELNLPLLSARTFAEVSQLGEPGWAGEAEQKAKDLRHRTSEGRRRWEQVSHAGRALIDAAPGPLPREFSQAPIARLFFYDAVRAAPSRDRVLALLPLARELDGRAQGHVLEEYVSRVAAADFSRRAPLAQEYAALLHQRLPEERKARLLSTLLESREDEDLLLGTLVQTRSVALHLDLFEKNAAASGDPWFQLLAAQERALAAKAAGRFGDATRTLLDAYRLCAEPGLEYRCISLERELSSLYIQLQQLDAAGKYARLGWEHARETNEWWLERDMLWNVAQIARFVNDTSLARACYGELLERDPENPDMVRRAHQNFAELALHELQVDEARREIDATLATGRPLSLSGAFALSDISRLRSAPGDEEHLLRALEAAQPELSPGERVVATHVRGRFFIERDVTRGRALLWRAIEEAGRRELQEDPAAQRARTYSFTSLLLDAGRRAAFGEALELFARERGQELPRQCLLAATVDSERTLLIARGPAGEQEGYHHEARRQPLPERLDDFVPEALLSVLRACPRVEVLARPPLHGRAGLLPLEMAWSYLTRTSAPPAQRMGRARHLAVFDVAIPREYALERLNPWVPSFGPDEEAIELSGAEATPSRVLDNMREATEITLVAHGLINGPSESSYLLLAPGREGPELRVRQLREASLQGAPFVVLAACRAAYTAYALQEPLSLPAAFMKAGARGVLAATVKSPDLDAREFFDAVRARIRAGSTPAIALRDERLQWLDKGRGAQWLGSVLLFE